MSNKTCSVEECNDKHYAKGYCERHYKQMKKYGVIKSFSKNTRFNTNEIILYDNYAEIILCDKYGNEKDRTLISLEDVEKCRQFKWSLNSYGYVKCTNLNMRLNRFIMDCPDDMVVDHINHNKLDNRRENLRICTSQQNNINMPIRLNNTSGTKGVTWREDRQKWVASITVNGKRLSKHCNTKEEAIEIRKQWEEEYFGEYRNIDI